MLKDERELARIPTGKENEYIVVNLFYSKGGANYFTGDNDQRGYFVSVTPRTITDTGFITTLFSGYKKFIQPANRFSAKQLAEVRVPQYVIDTLVQAVATKNNLTVTVGGAK